MTLEMNMFNICKQPGDDNDLHEVAFIDELVHENFVSTLPSDSLEACLITSNDFQLDINSEISHMLYFLNTFQDSKVSGWRPKFEELPPQSSVPVPSCVQSPKLNLKSLPADLKYSFLGDNETFSVIISSKLDTLQNGKLIQTLKMHKNALGWTIADLKGINPLICTHKIYLEENTKHLEKCSEGLTLT